MADTILPASAQTLPLPSSRRNSSQRARVTPSLLTTAAIVKQEANLLRFPFFALGRKRLSNRKGILIRGRTTLDEKPCDFEYRITCNTADLYPGPLARKVHYGLLYLLQANQTLPYQNPIEFTWRQLARTIGCNGSGAMQQLLKEAIRSIQGTCIRSTYALKNKDGVPLKSRERGFSLYREYIFFNEVLPDSQTLADKNFVWLSDWYLHNLNSLYCGPLDFQLWLRLDERSPIASRLYEFLTFNFTGPWSTFTIDYENLCRFLPVAPKAHLSQVEQQFAVALKLLLNENAITESSWAHGKRGQLQLTVHRGERLGSTTGRRTLPDNQLEATEVRNLLRQQRPEDELICQFHSLMFGDDAYRPTSADRQRARDVLERYEPKQAEQLLPKVVALVQERFPHAKTFGATTHYWPEAAEQCQRVQKAAQRRTEQFVQEQADEDKRARRDQQRQQLAPIWAALSPAEHEDIRKSVLAKQPLSLQKYPRLVMKLCLNELARRKGISLA